MSFDDLLHTLTHDRLASRIWNRETGPFARHEDTPDVRKAVTSRLGWLDAPTHMTARLPELQEFVAGAERDGLTDVYLLAMGGSSLCAEVLRDVPAAHAQRVRLVILDTTDEQVVRDVTAAIVPSRTLFLVSSKSGSTIEVTSLESHFRSVMTGRAASVGRHFAAITDPNTSLAAHAATHDYRHTFINPPDIGGRYSVLSLFGLVPAALLGWDVADLLASAQRMAARCRADASTNPGLALGAFMAANARHEVGRDKLTLLAPHTLAPLGAWIEQLVAESTGKLGRGVLPVVGEPIGAPQEYGRDRAFVTILTGEARDERSAAERLEAAGHPVFRIDSDERDLGGEFFRWEFATAVAGAGLDLNPFDEPDVRAAKTFTQKQLDAHHRTGAFALTPPLSSGDGAAARREHRASQPEVSGGRYVAVLDYTPGDSRRAAAIDRLRVELRRRLGVATTYGVGPRYLHSTGQYHKGGRNTGTFLLLTAADTTATNVPGTDYTFSTLKRAQALGDFDALVSRQTDHKDRHVVHYHFENTGADLSTEIERVARELK